MVFRRSEYGRNFKVSNLVKNIPTYLDNLTYRNHRRELEFAHTPIAWGPEEKLPVQQEEEVSEKLEKLKVNESEDEKVECKEDVIPDQVNKDDTTKHVECCDTEVQHISPDDKKKKQLAKEKLSKYSSHKNQNANPSHDEQKPALQKKMVESLDLGILKPQKVADKTFVKRTKPQSATKATKSSSRPQSAPAYKPQKRAPFLSYGCGDMERKLGTQRTHNVHASADVYPAAQKAYVKLQEDTRKRKDKELQTALRAKRKRALLKEKLLREAAFWQTEYQSNFPLHSGQDYYTNWERPKRCKSAFGP